MQIIEYNRGDEAYLIKYTYNSMTSYVIEDVKVFCEAVKDEWLTVPVDKLSDRFRDAVVSKIEAIDQQPKY